MSNRILFFLFPQLRRWFNKVDNLMASQVEVKAALDQNRALIVKVAARVDELSEAQDLDGILDEVKSQGEALQALLPDPQA